MSSLLPGFEYDIFISYRQKDNKGDRWVSEFVEALKTELESTFKEEVSVYFDINPHDGLLETHEVGDSLKEKLKCLVFIPIISRTYCDPKSFAWQHEFIAFVEQASQDQFGLKVRLPNGNIGSRVLPVRIHDLNSDDIKECEAVIGGVLRGIEFIYKEPGVNKPLKTDDDVRKNLNGTRYGIQINKTANAIHEIIQSFKNEGSKDVRIPAEAIKMSKTGIKKRKWILIAFTSFLLLVAGLIFRDSIFSFFSYKTVKLQDECIMHVEISENPQNNVKKVDPELIAYLIKFNLSNRCNLTILDDIQFDNIYPRKKGITDLPQKNVNIKVIMGESIHHDEIELKIVDNLNNSKTEDKINFRDLNDFLNFTGALSRIVDIFGTAGPRKDFITNDWSAFENFYKGEKEWSVRNKVDAIQLYETSLELDSSFLLPYLRLANIYHHTQDEKLAFEYIDLVVRSINKLTKPDSLRARALWNTLHFENAHAINNYGQIIGFMPAQKESYFDLAEAYFRICNIDGAIENYIKALKIDPGFTLAHNHLAYCYSSQGKHDSALVHVRKYLELDSSANAWDSYGDILFAMGDLEKASYAKKKGLSLDDRLDYLYETLAYINVQQGLIGEALKNIDKYIALQEEPNIKSRGLTDKAFIYFVKKEYKRALDTCRKALSIYDSKDLLTRNHVMHWILSKLYLESDNMALLNLETKEMDEIISMNKVNGYNNYNMILKFFYDIRIHEMFRQNKIEEAQNLIDIFDNEIYDKVKDWNYPFDISYFNSEFGKLYLEKDSIRLAKERFEKALAYNPKYIYAHMGLTVYFDRVKDTASRNIHYNQFYQTVQKADPEIKLQFIREFARMKN